MAFLLLQPKSNIGVLNVNTHGVLDARAYTHDTPLKNAPPIFSHFGHWLCVVGKVDIYISIRVRRTKLITRARAC